MFFKIRKLLICLNPLPSTREDVMFFKIRKLLICLNPLPSTREDSGVKTPSMLGFV